MPCSGGRLAPKSDPGIAEADGTDGTDGAAGTGGTGTDGAFLCGSFARLPKPDGVGGVPKLPGPWSSGDIPPSGTAAAPNGEGGTDGAAGIAGVAGIDGAEGIAGAAGRAGVDGIDGVGGMGGAGCPHAPNAPVAAPPVPWSLAGGPEKLSAGLPRGLSEDGCGPRAVGADRAPKICVYSPGFASGICGVGGVGAADEGAGSGGNCGCAGVGGGGA
jgi:hypothetical protein